MRYFFLAACFCPLLLLLTGCEFSVSTASLSEPALALKVDEKTQAPLEKADNISPETGTIYATIKVNNAPGDTQVKAVFFFKDGEEHQIAENTLAAHASGWPAGGYRVQFYLDEQPEEQLQFSVLTSTVAEQSTTQTPMPSQPTSREQVQERTHTLQYKRLNDNRFGFSFEVPAGWDWKVIPETTDYLVSGPAGSESREITVIVQVVDTRLGGVISLKEQMLDLVGQFSLLPAGSVVKKDQFEIAGKVAPFFIATYQANNSKQQQVEFGHTQLGLENPPYLLLVSYAAPRDIYQRELGVFQHMMDTFELRAPSQ